MLLAVLVAATLGCAPRVAPAPTRAVSPAAAPSAWDEFWRAHSVAPAPPRTFMDDDAEPQEIQNVTYGLLGDDVVRKWVLAAQRRGRADAWAGYHMRLDIVNAGVFGPPGLNGTDQMIAEQKAKGAVEMRCAPSSVVAAGVITVSNDAQARMPSAELTDFVVVTVRRFSDEPCELVRADGTTEALPTKYQRGQLRWQLDTGEFRDDPVVGPLWYQARGWMCPMNGTSGLDVLCGLVRPTAGTVAVGEP